MKIIPLFPNAPSSRGKDIHKHLFRPVSSRERKELQSVSCQVIGEREKKSSPSVFTEVTSEEEVFDCFFHPIITHSAVESIAHIIVTSSKHIPGV